MYGETIDSSLKDQSDDMDFNYCYGRGYAAHCLRTTERARNTSAQCERHGETLIHKTISIYCV